MTTMQWISLSAFVISAALCLVWAHFRVRQDFWFMINPICYALHGTIYYMAYALDSIEAFHIHLYLRFHDWSQILRFHSVVALIGMTLFLMSHKAINGDKA